MNRNLDDEIRNKIQSSKTIVELLNSGKRPFAELVKIAFLVENFPKQKDTPFLQL